MKNSGRNLLLVYCIVVFSIIFNQRVAQSACIASDCDALGYKYTKAECGDSNIVVCPFDNSKVFCKPAGKPKLIINWFYSPGIKIVRLDAKKNGESTYLGNLSEGTYGSFVYENVAVGDVFSSFSGYGMANDSPSGSESWELKDLSSSVGAVNIAITESKEYTVTVMLSPADRDSSQSYQPKILCTEFSGVSRTPEAVNPSKGCASSNDFVTYFQNTTNPLVKVYTDNVNPTTRTWSGGVCSELYVPDSQTATFYAQNTVSGCGYNCSLNKVYYMSSSSTTIDNATEFATLNDGYFTSSKTGTWYANYKCN